MKDCNINRKIKENNNNNQVEKCELIKKSKDALWKTTAKYTTEYIQNVEFHSMNIS